MNDQALIEALNNCIERLIQGETIEDCLHAHPAHAERLRQLLPLLPMLHRLHSSPREVDLAYHRVGRRVEDMLHDFSTPHLVPQRDKTPIHPRRVMPLRWMAAALLLLMLGGLFLLFMQDETIKPAQEITLTASAYETLSASATFSATPSASPSPSLTLSPTVSPSVSPTSTSTPTQIPTQTPTLTRTPRPSASPTYTQAACVPTIPEGWLPYTVRPGDTLTSLAANYNVSPDTVRSANCVTGNPREGLTVYLPPVTVTPAPSLTPGRSDAASDETSTENTSPMPASGGSNPPIEDEDEVNITDEDQPEDEPPYIEEDESEADDDPPAETEDAAEDDPVEDGGGEEDSEDTSEE